MGYEERDNGLDVFQYPFGFSVLPFVFAYFAELICETLNSK